MQAIFLAAITLTCSVSERFRPDQYKEPFLIVHKDMLVFRLDLSFLLKVVSVSNGSRHYYTLILSQTRNAFQNLDVRRALLQYIEATKD